jgi:nicotinamide mononucleotide transporter
MTLPGWDLWTWVENIAVVFGLVSVYLSAKERIASWPTAIVNVGLYFFLFWHSKLYADAVLQIVYLVLSVYGWYEWLYGGAQHSTLHVTHAKRVHWLVSVPLAAAFAIGLGYFMSKHTDSPVPYLDASLTAVSLVAQWMMTRKLLENWLVWIAVNLVYVPTFVSRHLPATAVQYAVFLVLASMGYVGWKRSLAADERAREAVAA